MTPEKISNRFCLFPAEGWDIQTFEKSNANTFYTYLLNHGECCLAWLSVQSKISVADLKKNNFKRENPFEKGLNLFRPLLLLVTDGNDWYISTLEEPEFVKKPLKDIQQNVLATIQICLAFYKKNQFDSTEINQLRLTGISLNKQIKLITEVEKPVGTRKTTGELYAEAEGEIDDSYEAMYRNGLERIKILEGVLRIQTRYVKDNSDLLHHFLFTTLSTKQLKALCTLTEDFIYINPWYKGKQLLVKATPVGVYENAHKKDVVNNRFYVLDSLGDFTGFSATLDDVKNTMAPGFLKFDKEFTKQYLQSLSQKKMGFGD
jgi:hypothetical protein